MQTTQPSRHFVLIMSALSLIILILIGMNWFYLTHQDPSEVGDITGTAGGTPRSTVQASLRAARLR